MKLIYIAHPFGGKQENIEKVQKIITDLIWQMPDHTFYSPLHATGFLYEELSYLDGMEHCFEVLSRCDELWLTGNWRESRGCKLEFGFATERSMVIKELNCDGKLLRSLCDTEQSEWESVCR